MAQSDETECSETLNEELIGSSSETKKSKGNSQKLYNNENIINQVNNKKSASNNAKSRNNLNKKILSDLSIIK